MGWQLQAAWPWAAGSAPPPLSPSKAADVPSKAQLQGMSAGITAHTSLTHKLSICAQLVGRLRQRGDN